MPDTRSNPDARLQPSLHQLAQKKLLEEIIRPGYKFTEFEGLESRLQRMLFEALQTETRRLQTVEESWVYMKEVCPPADFFLYQKPVETTPEDSWTEVADEDSETSEDPAAKQERRRVIEEKIQSFKDLWKPVSESHYLDIDPDHENYIRWDDQTIWARSREADLERIDEDDGNWGQVTLDKEISSQSLWYRLTMILEEPMLSKCHSDSRKYWRFFDLELYDGSALLCLCDTAPGSNVTFYGIGEASSAKALELLNYVCGNGCMKPGGFVFRSSCIVARAMTLSR